MGLGGRSPKTYRTGDHSAPSPIVLVIPGGILFQLL
jgi:hypothetical protein